MAVVTLVLAAATVELGTTSGTQRGGHSGSSQQCVDAETDGATAGRVDAIGLHGDDDRGSSTDTDAEILVLNHSHSLLCRRNGAA